MEMAGGGKEGAMRLWRFPERPVCGARRLVPQRGLAVAVALALAGCAGNVPRPAVTEAPAPVHTSSAWARFDAKRITAAQASGVADKATGRALTIDDPVRVASISKLVVALAVMRLAEQGKIDLDRDVSDYLGWRLRNPAYPEDRITLRLLLSHRSSLRDEVNYVIPLGQTVQGVVADPRAFDPEHRPGSFYRYSNLGFPVIGTVLEKATGERFDRLMRRLVLEPMKLDACFNWSGCSDAKVARAGVLYRATGAVALDDLKGKPPECPVNKAAPDAPCDLENYRIGTHGGLFSPQGGLRVSITDLARIGQLLLRKGRLEDGTRLVSEASLAAMMRPQWRAEGSNGDTEKGFYCAYGLAVQILGQCAPGDDPFGDGRTRFGHAGDAYGLKSGLWIDPERGTGIAYFATAIGEDGPRGRSAYWTIEEWLAAKARGASR
jgi:CubicO group peptidase (beta-lactamase class C family)